MIREKNQKLMHRLVLEIEFAADEHGQTPTNTDREKTGSISNSQN